AFKGIRKTFSIKKKKDCESPLPDSIEARLKLDLSCNMRLDQICGTGSGIFGNAVYLACAITIAIRYSYIIDKENSSRITLPAICTQSKAFIWARVILGGQLLRVKPNVTPSWTTPVKTWGKHCSRRKEEKTRRSKEEKRE
ncbi:hypothetical protein GPALN_002249, partial [Globodera pallida]